MSKIELLKKVMHVMEPEMTRLGFKKSFSRQMFIRDKDQDFIVAYSLIISDRFNMAKNKAGIVIEPYIYIHNKPIEKIYARITTRQIDHISDLKTIGNQLADIIANPSGKYEVRNQKLDLFMYSENDIEEIAQKLMGYFQENVLPYFEEYATWKGLDDVLNNNLSYYTVHCQIEPERSLRGLIVARLLGRNDIDHLITIHSERISKMGNVNYEIELNRLLNILDTISLS
jgi:hypothetical protein